MAVPAQAAASYEGSDSAQPQGEFSAAAEFVDAQQFDAHYAAINALASQGVLDGSECGHAVFCADEPLARWVMAVWLVRFLDGGEPDTVGEPRFDDVDTVQWWAPHVERLAQLGITEGCAPERYCPHETVTRAQMASFLSRALGLASSDGSGFDDVGDGVHAANVKAVVAAGIADECSPGRYCPRESVTRGRWRRCLTTAATGCRPSTPATRWASFAPPP